MEATRVKADLHHLDLMNGYIKEQFDAYEKYHHFEVSLINVLIAFLGNILYRFDVYPPKFEFMFSDEERIFTRTINNRYKGTDKSCTFGSSYDWNEGIYKVCIKCKDSTSCAGDAFGITSDINCFETIEGWYNEGHGFSYILNGTSRCLCTMNDATNKSNVQYLGTREWKSDDKISICFDADNWTVSWYLNNERLGIPFNVVPYQNYHLFISSGVGSISEYHIMNDH